MTDLARRRGPAEVRLDASAAHPRHWGTWFLLLLSWLLARLPFRVATRLGEVLGALLYRLGGRRRHIAATNIQLCFPELSAAERRVLVRENFRYTGRGIVETALAWWAPDASLVGRVRFKGWEHFERAQADGRGVLMLCGHFTCLEMGGRFLSQRLSFDAVYRPHNSPVMEYFTHRSRAQRAGGAIPREDVRGLVRALRKGRAVFYLPDQDYGRRHSAFVPFFGIPASTITAVSRIARMSGAAVMPLYYFVRDDGGYDVEFGEPLQDFPGEDPTADAARINRLFEDAIRRAPAQYLWVHRRFKTRPEPQEPGFY